MLNYTFGRWFGSLMASWSSIKKCNMKRITVLLFIALIGLAAYFYFTRSQNVHELFLSEFKNPEIHNAFLAIYSEPLNIDWNWAEGAFKDGDPVTQQNPFHTASIGKTFTATVIAILKEEGKLNYKNPISDYLDEEVMQHLHVLDGVDHSNGILIEHLLQHRSGLPDYFEDQPDSGQSVMELMLEDPDHFWTPTEVLSFAKTQLKPHFEPGTDYYYTDTEYVLLGMIIQNITEKPLHIVFREKIFEPLGMKHTSMHLRSEPIEATGRMAEVYADDMEISGFRSISADWAGGGLLTTCQDLMTFHQALVNGKIISELSFKEMQNWTPATKGMYYGYGLYKIQLKELFFTLPDVTLIGHSGSTGSFMYYCPEWDIYLTGSFNQLGYLKNHIIFLSKVLSLLKDEAENQ